MKVISFSKNSKRTKAMKKIRKLTRFPFTISIKSTLFLHLNIYLCLFYFLRGGGASFAGVAISTKLWLHGYSVEIKSSLVFYPHSSCSRSNKNTENIQAQLNQCFKRLYLGYQGCSCGCGCGCGCSGSRRSVKF